jgi:hypothetical protein
MSPRRVLVAALLAAVPLTGVAVLTAPAQAEDKPFCLVLGEDPQGRRAYAYCVEIPPR